VKIAITGGEGTIGRELLKHGCVPIMGDITYSNDIYTEVQKINPDVLIHCAALTDVAYCESHFKESFEVNVRGTSNVVDAMPKDSLFVYLSTDHVFEGRHYFKEGYGEWRKPSPVNRYGFSKWGGELAAQTGNCKLLIVRSSKCYNYEWAKPTIDRLNNGEEIVITDVVKRSFYHVQHFADSLMYLINHYKDYHDLDIINISGDCIYSYFMFWLIVQRQLGLGGKIKPREHEVKDETPRPLRGGLNVKQAQKLGIPIHPFKEGIELLGKGV
jgi:dTDP-4-dehydrorhamnose reductase